MSELKKATMEHYDRLASCRTHTDFCNEGWTADSCPLCQVYHPGIVIGIHEREPCTGCPVKNKTGHGFCRTTPWSNIDYDIDTMLARVLEEPLPSVLEMREFLESLDWSNIP